MTIQKIGLVVQKNTLQSVFDDQGLTAIEVAAAASAKVDECVDLVNGVEQTAIEAQAIVDNMEIQQEQFILDNADARTQIVNDNQNYIDSLNTAKAAFEADMTETLDTFEADTATAKTAYENSLNTSKTTFETNMTNAVNTIIANANTTINTDVSNKIDTLVSNGTITSLLGTMVDDVEAEITVLETSVATDISALQTSVNNQLTALQTDINAQLDTDFTNFNAEFSRIQLNVMFPPSPLVAALANGTDDSPAVQACIDYVNTRGGGSIIFPDGYTFKLNTTINLKSKVKLVMGATTVLDMTTLTSLPKTCISAVGTLDASKNLSTDAVKGAMSVNLSSVAGLAIGDWVQLATLGVNFYPYNGSYNVDRGEIKRIYNISGNTVTFEEGFYDGYTVANGAFIRKINFVENVGVTGGIIKGDTNPASGEHGIYLQYVNGFDISYCELQNQDLYQIGLASCIRGNVHHNRGRMSFYDGVTGSVFYGIALLDSTQWVNVFANDGEKMRHLVINTSHSGGQGYFGQPRFIDVYSNFMRNAMINDIGRSYAYEHHGFGEFIKYHHNFADSCYCGFNIEGGGIEVSDNVITNFYFAGISVEDGSGLKNIIIRNNTIEKSLDAGATPIKFIVPAGATLENIRIEGNTINHDLTALQGIYLTCVSALVAKNLVIANNVIKNTNTNVGSTYAILVNNIDGATIRTNEIYDTSNGINVVGNETEILNNNIDVDASRTLASGYGIYSNGNDNWINGNTIRRSFTGVRIYTAKTGNIYSNNIVRSDNATLTDGGTATSKQNNIEIVY